MWIPLWVRCLLFSLFPSEDRKLYSSASARGGLLLPCWGVLGSLHDGMAPDSPTAEPNSSADDGQEIRLRSEWARVEGTYGLVRPHRGEDLVYIHRQTTQQVAISPDPWEPISVGRDEFPDEILADMAMLFADIHEQWREISWWQSPPYCSYVGPAHPKLFQLCSGD